MLELLNLATFQYFHQRYSQKHTLINSSWIEIYVNNELIEAQQFRAGDTYSRKVQIPFKIVVGNADSLKGTYNGEMIDFSTDNDSLYGVKTVLFDDE